MTIRRVVSPIFCLSLALTHGAVAAEVHVQAGQSIQGALEQAQPGDQILVEPGTYPEAIDFLGKDVAVIGVGGSWLTILDATGTGTSAVAASPPTAWR